MDKPDTIRAVMLGHAVGDALGVPVEFCEREELDEDPVTGMLGYGTYPFPAGCWSDDTSMALAALDSLADGKLDFDDVMIKLGEWYYNDKYTVKEDNGEFGLSNVAATCVNFLGYEAPSMWDASVVDVK